MKFKLKIDIETAIIKNQFPIWDKTLKTDNNGNLIIKRWKKGKIYDSFGGLISGIIFYDNSGKEKRIRFDDNKYFMVESNAQKNSTTKYSRY